MFAYAKLSRYDFGVFRLLGDGLGNLLFPWARAIVGAQKYGLTAIWPTWIQFKVGPFLRCERDKRFYSGLFRPSDEYISGFKKLCLLAICSRLSELDFFRNSGTVSSHAIVIFNGMEDYFKEIITDHALVKHELLKIIRHEHEIGIKSCGNSIAVHVRLGDFSLPKEQMDLDIEKSGHTNFRLPLIWYISMVRSLRRKLGDECKVYVFSDGREDELAELLTFPNCQRLSFGSSIADLLALSSSDVLIASGSTFSMWASYLGRMPVIWHPGQLRQRLYYERPNAEIELGQGQDVPESFIETIVTDSKLQGTK